MGAKVVTVDTSHRRKEKEMMKGPVVITAMQGKSKKAVAMANQDLREAWNKVGKGLILKTKHKVMVKAPEDRAPSVDPHQTDKTQ